MDVPVLIVTYKRIDFVLEILLQLQRAGLNRVYLSVDDYYSTDEIKKVETYLSENQFDFKILKWEKNVGCDVNVMEGIRWFFEHEQSGLILEDDCIPTNGCKFLLDNLNKVGLDEYPVSFFSTNVSGASTLQFYQSFLPIYWGWYSTKSFFMGFYQFYSQPPSSLKVVKSIWQSGLTNKLKLITIINYFGHRTRKKGIAWDSELLTYLFWSKSYFWVPSLSFIQNKGFGELAAAHTHTSSIPEWYGKVKYVTSDEKVKEVDIQKTYPSSDMQFLNIFFSNYSDNNAKLLVTAVKSYFEFLFRRSQTR